MWSRRRKHFLEASLSHLEEVLLGGLETGRVLKVGQTVRRAAGPWTPTIQALLAHLHIKGFPAPQPMGLDEQGREVVSFLEGRASNWPWPAALLDVSGAKQVGALLRRYHAAARDFVPPSPALWRHGPQALAAGEVVLHGDFGPHNLIWSETDVAGVIDFELARPGDPLEDAGFAVIRVAQLRPDEMTRPVGFAAPPDRGARLAAFADGFGAPPATLVQAALRAQAGEIERIVRLGGAGVEPWASFRRRGLEAQARAELDWLTANAGALL
jgi:Phosphotransferase enzyme family